MTSTDGSTDAVRLTAEGGVRILTLNRPEAMNAFGDDMHLGFLDALRTVCTDSDARAVVITGAGRAFSAGGDIEEFEVFANDLHARRRILRLGRQLFDDLVNVHVPVVAAVNGPAVGLGCTVVSACDAVFMSDKSYLADPHVTVALVAGDGGAVTWPLNAGLLRAKRYLLTGDRITPQDAVEIGMATEVVDHDSVLTEAVAFAQRLAAMPWQAVQDTKYVLNQHLRQAATGGLGLGIAVESQSHDTAEYRAVPEQFRARAAARSK